MKKITQERLKELLSYNETTGIFTWKKTRNNAPSGRVAGSIGVGGYVEIGVDNGRYTAHRLAWLYVHGYFPEYGIDHIDRDRTNNKISNLREATPQCNTRNARVSKNNSSGVKGISFHKKAGKWGSSIMVDRKQVHLGLYSDIICAAYARHAAEVALDFPECDTVSSAKAYIDNFEANNGREIDLLARTIAEVADRLPRRK